MNAIVLVGFFIRPPTPFASRPNSFADDVLQLFLYFGFFIGCLQLRSFPVSVSMTAKAWWTSFSSWAIVASTVDSCPVFVLFSNIVNWVCDIVLIDGGASAVCVRDLVLCAGAVVWNLVLCFWFCVYSLFLLTVPPSELMVWIIGVLEDSAASLILSDVCCCWCTAAPSIFLERT